MRIYREKEVNEMDFQAVASGDWTDLSVWEYYDVDDETWKPAPFPPMGNDMIMPNDVEILNGVTVNLNRNVEIGGTLTLTGSGDIVYGDYTIEEGV